MNEFSIGQIIKLSKSEQDSLPGIKNIPSGNFKIVNIRDSYLSKTKQNDFDTIIEVIKINKKGQQIGKQSYHYCLDFFKKHLIVEWTMQTFLPYADFYQSYQSLDKTRLQKQILETTQLLDCILNLPTKTGKPRKGWMDHPALLMWKNNPGSLVNYLRAGIKEAQNRNIKTDYAQSKLLQYETFNLDPRQPIWLGDSNIHSSHKSRLLQKGWEQKFKGQKNTNKIIEWYQSFKWPEMYDPELMQCDYKWPVNIIDDTYELGIKVSKTALKFKNDVIKAYGLNPYNSSLVERV